MVLFHPRHPMMILCTGNNDIFVFNTCDWSYCCVFNHNASTILFNIQKVVCHPYLPQIICWDPSKGDLIATVDLRSKQIFHKNFIPRIVHNQEVFELQISGDGKLVATVFATKKYELDLHHYSFAGKALKGFFKPKKGSNIRLMSYDQCVKLDKGEHNYLEQIDCPGLRVKQTWFAPRISLFFFWTNTKLYAYRLQNNKLRGHRIRIPLLGSSVERFIRHVSFDPHNKRRFLVCTNTYVSLFAVDDNMVIRQIGFVSETGFFGSLQEIQLTSFHPTMNYVHQLGVKAFGHHIRSMEGLFTEWPRTQGLQHVATDIKNKKLQKWMPLASTIRTDCMHLTFHPRYPVAVVYRNFKEEEYVAVINLQKIDQSTLTI